MLLCSVATESDPERVGEGALKQRSRTLEVPRWRSPEHGSRIMGARSLSSRRRRTSGEKSRREERSRLDLEAIQERLLDPYVKTKQMDGALQGAENRPQAPEAHEWTNDDADTRGASGDCRR